MLEQWKAQHEAWIAGRLNRGELDSASYHHVVWQEGAQAMTTIGDGNVVIVNQAGVSCADARQIAEDVFEKNFVRLSGDARASAVARAASLTENFLSRLRASHPECLDNMSQPEVRNALFKAQKAHALSEEGDKLEVLADMLVRRCSMQDSAFTNIVLSEAIDITSKLTGELIDTLSRFALSDPPVILSLVVDDEKAFVHEYVLAFAGNLATTYGELNYLATCGCIASAGAWEHDGDRALQALRTASRMHDAPLSSNTPHADETRARFELLDVVWSKSRVTFRFMGLQPIGAAIALANLQRVTGARWDLER